MITKLYYLTRNGNDAGYFNGTGIHSGQYCLELKHCLDFNSKIEEGQEYDSSIQAALCGVISSCE